MKQTAFLSIPLLAFSLLTHWRCSRSEAEPTPLETAREQNCISDTLSHMLLTATAQTEPVEDALQLSGEVSFDQDKVVRVLPLTSGQVLDVNVSLGDYVHAGQLLATLKSAEVAGLYQESSSATADLATAEKNLQNAKALVRSGMATDRDVTQAQSDYDKAQSNLERSKEVISIYGQNNTSRNGLIAIKAPISGYIVEKKISAGTQVRPDNADNLFTISDLRDVWVLANVYENDLARLHEGCLAEVSTLAYPDKVFRGKIDHISEVLDPENKVLKARICLPNPGNLLRPEMFTAVRVRNENGFRAVTIPASAPIMDFGKSYVIVLHDPCHYEARQVHILKTTGEKAYLKDGLAAGESVVTKEQLLLFNKLKEL